MTPEEVRNKIDEYMAQGAKSILVRSKEGPITMATPAGHIWEVIVEEHSWGKQIIIVQG
jgi:hypothetical protein